MRVGILTVSDRASSGEYQDESGPLIQRFVQERLRWEIGKAATVGDDREAIKSTLIQWADGEKLDLILTTGGTGFAPRDVTPEATRAAIERETPGLAEAMRAASLRATPHAMLSRAVCGIRGRSLIVNLPGSPKAIYENMETLEPVLPHALALLADSPDASAGHQSLRRA